MKKLLKIMAMLFACIAISAGLAACSSDDDDEPADSTLKEQIVGAWVMPGSGYIFKKDGTGIAVEGWGEVQGRWPITYSISGKHVSITDMADNETYEEFNVLMIEGDEMFAIWDNDDDDKDAPFSMKRTTEAALQIGQPLPKD